MRWWVTAQALTHSATLRLSTQLAWFKTGADILDRFRGTQVSWDQDVAQVCCNLGNGQVSLPS